MKWWQQHKARRATREPRSLRELIKIMAVGFVMSMVAMVIFGMISIDGATRSATEAKNAAASATAAIDQANADRAERSHGSCIQYNVKQLQDRVALVRAAIKALVPDDAVLTSEQQAALDGFRDRYTAEVSVQLPYRDCSPAGIDQFLKNPPPDPATTAPGATP